MAKKIVVITPVKNESWIINSFLLITSHFADLIIIYDDLSTDNTRDICKSFKKVYLIQGQADHYNESLRQSILISKARELIEEDKIILALDADELLIYSALNSNDWREIRNADTGTTLYFEKPDLVNNYSTCLRHPDLFILGYVDDGKEHKGSIVHSTRVPVTDNNKKLLLKDIKFMHLALLRRDAYISRQRFYKVIENVNSTKSLFQRYKYYNGGVKQLMNAKLSPTPVEWYKPWIDNKILPENFEKREYYWYDIEVIKYIKKYGEKRFWNDDIWDCDYNTLINKYNLNNILEIDHIQYPKLKNKLIIMFLRLITELNIFIEELKELIRR